VLSDDQPSSPPARRRIDVIASPEFLDDLAELDTDEIRRRRELCGGLERELSYYRRLLHGRLDLLAFERRRRSGEETRELIEALPDILCDGTPPTEAHITAEAADLAPPTFEGPGRRSVDLALGDDFLARIPELTDEELDDIEATLAGEERSISSQRRLAQEARDALGAEVGRRYREGMTSVDDLFSN
jgi:hypothetical protein